MALASLLASVLLHLEPPSVAVATSARGGWGRGGYPAPRSRRMGERGEGESADCKPGE